MNGMGVLTAIYLLQKGWEVRDGRVYFPVEESEKEALASGTIIENTIGYAHELEIIV